MALHHCHRENVPFARGASIVLDLGRVSRLS